ncbi:MAG TPA: (E)-4-hydroxy-3-methylbut-2-enyl-diphosphate synthase [Chloroflexota bacterium]
MHVSAASPPPGGGLRYCADPYRYRRRRTRVVMVGDVGVGGDNPIRVQSMTTTRTQDVEATVAQVVRLVEAGCEIVRITAPTVQDARCLKDIRAALRRRGIRVPLVADIHFSPAAAMEAALHVEKVRINPGNFADAKRFDVREYADEEYQRELERIEERFRPLVLRCKELGVAMRIGTNHGSLSDRIMNRYGDTPLGMVESALEFVRICERYGYRDIILSMKASNPKVMIEAYRLLVARMDEEGMDYPLHLGVTEAGDGEDGRCKSAVGIGTLLDDGLGDTVRVSLTEEPEAEIPVAYALVEPYNRALRAARTERPYAVRSSLPDRRSPFEYARRPSAEITVGRFAIGGRQPTAVIHEVDQPLSRLADPVGTLLRLSASAGGRGPWPDVVAVPVLTGADVARLGEARGALTERGWDLAVAPLASASLLGEAARYADLVVYRPEGAGREPSTEDGATASDYQERDPAFRACLVVARERRLPLLIETRALPPAEPDGVDLETVEREVERLLRQGRAAQAAGCADVLLGVAASDPSTLVRMGRLLAARLADEEWKLPLHLRLILPRDRERALLDASVALGSLLCDGIGDSVALSGEGEERLRLAFNVLQAAGARITKTEFVACPSCGRTLFDLQTTTERIRSKTGHLKGVKIAIMGCVVNGPGEMADADFGYVGGSPGKVNLYVGKECVERNVPQEEADERLIALIRSHGKWVDPPSE